MGYEILLLLLNYVKININTSAGAADDANVNLTLSGVNQTTGTTASSLGGTLPYYSQTSGSLTLANNTNLSMVDSSLIRSGNLTIDNTSIFNSLSNGFTVANLQTAGTISGINGTYENYAVTKEFRIGDGGANNQANFSFDLYARNNTNVSFDTFGSTGTPINAANDVVDAIDIKM